MTIDEQVNILTRGCVEILPADELKNMLEQSEATGIPLRIKFGADPTAPDIHLGHSIILKKLREFQDLGHKVVFIIGDFTAGIGDPTGRNSTRPVLSDEEIIDNAETYIAQAFKILDKNKTVVTYNSRWLKHLKFSEVVRLMSHVTVAQLLEREDFSARLKSNTPISMHELLYPILQGFDSVTINADIEVGGTDQKFNLLMGRSLQGSLGKRRQLIMTLPLLLGTDGVEKMSKSKNNHIGIAESPNNMFGKIMKISDGLMLVYWLQVIGLSMRECALLYAGQRNPRDIKLDLAEALVKQFHSKEQAKQAREEFVRQFTNRQLPSVIEKYEIKAFAEEPFKLTEILVMSGLAPNYAEAKRLISGGGVKVNGEKIENIKHTVPVEFGKSVLLQRGKLHYRQILFAPYEKQN